MYKHLRYRRRKGRGDSGDLGAFCSFLDERVRLLSQKRDILAGAVFQHERYASGSANARNRRRRKHEGPPLRYCSQSSIRRSDDMLNVFFRAFPLFPFLERYEKERIVGTGDGAKQAVTGNGGYLVDTRRVQQNVLHLLCSVIRPLERRGVWKR
jgi:hypothetical protein